MTTFRKVYWDACVFIAHISRVGAKSVLDGIDEVIEEAEQGRAVVLTSSITRIEVLDCKIDDANKHLFPAFLRRSDVVQEFDVDIRIASAAHDIRDFYRREGHNITLGDCIHVATACSKEADEMFTLDGSGKKRGLIALSGRIADRWDMPIYPPRAINARLFTIAKTRPTVVAPEDSKQKAIGPPEEPVEVDAATEPQAPSPPK